MIASGYSVDLYCDAAPANRAPHGFHDFPQTFFAETRKQCTRQAEKRGWRIDWKTRRAVCPKCAELGKRP